MNGIIHRTNIARQCEECGDIIERGQDYSVDENGLEICQACKEGRNGEISDTIGFDGFE